jgi:hypothetical protein
MLIAGLDLEDGAPGATLGLYIKPQTRPRWPPAQTSHPLDGMLNPCRKGGFAALRELGPVD